MIKKGNNCCPLKPKLSASQPEAGAMVQAWADSCCIGSAPGCSTPFTRLMKHPAQTFINERLVLLFFLVVTLCFTPAAGTQEEDVMHFPDRNLEAAVRAALERPGGILTPADMQALTELEAGQYDIRDLTGLEYAANLESLSLYNNHLEDLSPLVELKELRVLNLNHNRLSDLAPLSGLTSLEALHLGGNHITNLTPLTSLTALRELYLFENRIKHIAPLTSLDKLETLNLDHNQVANLTPLGELSLLGWLSLEGNTIEDLDPLAALTELEFLNVNDNRVHHIEALAQLDNLGWLEIRHNYLDTDEGTPAIAIIQDLLERNAAVSYQPQQLPRIRGDASVWIPEGSTGSVLQTPPRDRLTILNHEKGWRIQSFTVDQQGAGPQDYLREIGHLSQGTGRFAWYSTPGRYRPRVGDDFPYTVTFHNPTIIQLGLSVQIWPGSLDKDQRLFYVSEIVLWNIHTKDNYTLELGPPENGKTTEPGLQPGEPNGVTETETLQIETIE